MEEFIYDCRWTTDVDAKYIQDWQIVENSVFGGFDNQHIERKYFKNPYGPSVLVVAYGDGIPVAADALWRNDVNGKRSYTSSDTCVLDAARGKGVMTQMVKMKVDKIGDDSYIYGSPNGRSYFGFKKLGWNIIPMYHAIFTSPKRYSKEYPDLMPREYAEWWITGQNKYHIKRGGHYYLVSTNRKFLMNLIAEVDKETAMMYPRYKKPALFIYRTYKEPWLKSIRKHAMHHISWKGDPGQFPYWKIDGYCE